MSMNTAYWEQLVSLIQKDLAEHQGRCPWTKPLSRIDYLLNQKCGSRKIESVELLNADVAGIADYLDESCNRIVEFDLAAKIADSPSPRTKVGKSTAAEIVRNKLRYHLDRELLDRYSSSW